ncbi:MAG: thiol-activated cytolysin family protein, partial [Candidatus Promineifilaceae bacterium]
ACNIPLASPGVSPLPTSNITPQSTSVLPGPTSQPTAIGLGGGDINQFVDGLPQWTDVSPTQTENSGVPAGEMTEDEETAADNTLYTCTTTPYNITKNPREIAIHNPDAAVLWPGALIRGESHLKNGSLELLAVSREKRAPLGISIQGGGVLGIPGGVSTIVEQPVGSTIREGINQIVVNALGADVAVGAGASSFTSVESYSSVQALLSLGLDARYLGSEVSGRLNYDRAVNEHTYTAYFVQRLFTVAVDLPERPSSFFADNVTAEDLQDLGISDDNLPLYIDSVSYGRILMFSFTSSDSREQIEAALEFSYNSPVGGVDGYAEAELQQTLSNARIEIFALGGPNTGVQNLIRNGNLSSYFEAPLAINQVEPISFTIRNLDDNRLAQVANTTDYEVKECMAAAASLPQPIHWWTADDTVADATGGVELGGWGGAYGAGWNGADPADKAFVVDGTGQYLNTYPVLQTVPITGTFTVSAWINPRIVGGVESSTIISQLGGRQTTGDFGFRVRSDGSLIFWRRPSSWEASVDVVLTGGGEIVPNRWTHVVAVYGSTTAGGGNLSIYVNGELKADRVFLSSYAAHTPRPDTDLTMTRIGASELEPDGSRRTPFNGSIDEIMVFDHALSGDEVMAMYQNFARYKQ